MNFYEYKVFFEDEFDKEYYATCEDEADGGIGVIRRALKRRAIDRLDNTDFLLDTLEEIEKLGVEELYHEFEVAGGRIEATKL